jgi:hypothetical protein
VRSPSAPSPGVDARQQLARPSRTRAGGPSLLRILLVVLSLALVSRHVAGQAQTGWAQAGAKSAAISTHAMAYDVARSRVVRFGGLGNTPGNPPGLLSATSEWDGSSWLPRSPRTSPSARYGHAMAYDVARQRVVLFGGATGDARNPHAVADTWHFGRPSTSQTFGTACSRSKNPPVLTSDLPYLGHPAFGLALLGARPAAPCVFGLAARRQNQPIPPCTLYLKGSIVPLLAVTNWAGFARSQTVALPLNPNLRGLTFYAQAFVADPQGPVSGLTFSGGLRLVLGD